ncbi:MAG: hypothetical protein IJA60_01400 [Clostridia bacterium]|nr:hypothetical protein [Clostridia bacterium]
MRKLLILSIILALFTVCVSAAAPIFTIDTSDAKEVYRNTFDDASALNDFTQYSGTWGVEDGKAYILPGQASANAYFVYTGSDTALHDMTDYVVSVDMYNVRQATGLVARCDLDTCSNALHGYMGVNASCQTNGTYFFTRVTNNTAGTNATSIGSAPVIFAPGANIRLEVAMRGELIQTAAYDLDTGMLLWVRTGVTELCLSGSFGLFAYTKIVNGLDVSETRFDNLTVKTLSPVSDAKNFEVSSALIDISGATEVYRNTFDDAASLNDFTQYSGTWGVENGKAYVLPGQASANAYFVYTGENTALHDLSDYVVEVDIYNLRQAEGLVARCDLDTCNTKIQGYMGVNANFNTAGTKAYNRVTKTADGSSAAALGTSAEICKPGANVHLTLVMKGTTVQYLVTDIDTGEVLCNITADTEYCPSGSFGLMAYTKVLNGLDNSDSRFDNLVVKTLPSNAGEALTKADFAAEQHGDDRIDLNANDTVAIHKTLTMANGTFEADMFMPAAANSSVLQAVKGDDRIDNAGIIFNRSADGSSYYKLQMYRRTYVATVTDGAISKISNQIYTRLYKAVGGTETLLEEFSMEASGLGSWGTVKLRAVVKDGKIYGYMNDRCYVSVTDETPLIGTGVGVFTNIAGTSFANINVSNVTTPDKADIVVWGHSHPGGWLNAVDEFAKYGKTVNVALGGSSTLDMPNIVDEMATYEPKVAVIMIGSNNMGYTVTKNVTDLDNSFDMLRELCPGIKFILITEWWQPVRLETYGDYVLSLNKAYREYADANDDVTIVEGWNIPIDENGNFDESCFKDTMHLNPAAMYKLTQRTDAALGYIIGGNMGDVNEDGKVDVSDILISLRMLVNSDGYLPYADRNFDGVIALIDVLNVLKNAVI